MTVSKDKFVAIHYTLKDDDGKTIDSSYGAEPLAYIQGNNMLIPGLEKEMEGKSAGEKFSTVIKPEDAYGIYDDRLVAVVTRDKFQEGVPIEVGMKFQSGPAIVTVTKIENDNITIDANHELAGKTLHFDIEVVEVKEPSEEDLAQFQNPGGGCGGCGGNCGGDCGGNCNCGEGGECSCGNEGGCQCGK